MKAIISIILFIIIFFIDRISKILVLNLQKIEVIKNFFYIEKIFNTGGIFGIGKGLNFLFIIIGFVIIAILLINIKFFTENFLRTVGTIFVLSGAFGNLFDRIFFGYVIDFIAFTFWPAFNFADAFISIGIIILLISVLKK